MDRGLALSALVAIPGLAALFHLLARSGLRPLDACLLGLSAYWLLLVIGLGRGGWSLRLRVPPISIALACLLPALLLAAFALPALSRLSPHVLAVVALAAALNGTLEEAFWRGALVRRLGPGDRGKAVVPVLLFALWHLAPATALAKLDMPGGAAGMILGAALLGALAMAARLGSGSAGFPALCHVLVNLATFGILAATNGWPALP